MKTSKKAIRVISMAEYNKIKKMSKEEILQGVLYKIHSLTVKDDKYTLTNAYFESRHGSFEVK